MTRRKRFLMSAAVAPVLLLLLPSNLFAQAATSGIAGVVKDSTGAVLPGVTVEASSPALIEKTRTVVTNGQGLYKIVDLRPGLYSVTFTLTGFSPLKREGVDLPPGFNATVDAELKLGGISEAVTVSGEAPLIDTQSNSDDKVLSEHVLEALAAQRNPNAFTPLIPGVVGNLGQVGVFGGTFTIHGSNISSTSLAIDGFNTNSMAANGAGFIYYVNMATVQASTVTLSGESAEFQQSGVRNDVTPKTGGNTYEGFMFMGGGTHSLQSNNFTTALQNSGLKSVNSLDTQFDVNPAWGGPIIKDRVWFYNAYRYDEEKDFLAGLFTNATPTAFTYTASNQKATNYVYDKSANVRITTQLSKNNKISAFIDAAPHCTCNRGFAATVSPEATQVGEFWPNYFGEARWTYTPTNKLLIEAGIGSSWGTFQYNRQPGVGLDTIAVSEQSTGMSFRANTVYGQSPTNPKTVKITATYVTGSHAAKFGLSDAFGQSVTVNATASQDVSYRELNGIPNQITVYAEPSVTVENMNADLGLFAQDRWTMHRLTLNYGVRFEYFNGSVPPQNEAALLAQYGQTLPLYSPIGTYAGVNNAPNWKDIDPRAAGVFDLFGDGKTALKISAGRYVAAETSTTATNLNPITTSVVSATRTWTDSNNNFGVDCNLNNPAANGECGAISNNNFGLANPLATTYNSDVTNGWFKRGYNWEFDAGVQRQVANNVSVNFTYYRRWYGNFSVTQNTDTVAGNYSPYCITVPVDPRLPGGGGNQVCGYYDVNPAQFGKVQSFVSQAGDFGSQQSVWDGYGLTTVVHLPKNGLIQGGVDQGRLRTNDCYALNQPQLSGLGGDPNISSYCNVVPPWQPQWKVIAVYPLPWWAIQVSAAYQRIPGPQITASFTATNAMIAPSLGRNLSAGANANATDQIIAPGTMYGPAVNELDISFRKSVDFGSKGRFVFTADVFNAPNLSDVITYNNTYGAKWLQPTAILTGRWLKLGGQFSF